MAPLLCFSPVIIDHSFPRSDVDLRNASVALGEIQQLMEQGAVEIVMTELLRDFVTEMDWSDPKRYSAMREIHILLYKMAENGADGVINVDLSNEHGFENHPIPAHCEPHGLCDLWSEEMGRLLSRYRRSVARESECVGIVCDSAFAGGSDCTFANGQDAIGDHFPLIGPDSVHDLDSAYEWAVDDSVRQKDVAFEQAKRNIGLLGCANVRTPGGGGSHYICEFAGARSWVLDKNTDPIPERFLKQLVDICDMKLVAIKHILILGERPRQRLRF